MERKKRALLLALVAGVVLTVAGVGYWIVSTSGPSVIRLSVAWEPEVGATGLTAELREFEQLYPQYSVKVEYHTALDQAALLQESQLPEVFMLADPSSLPIERFRLAPVAWTGSGWGLYYNKSALAKVGIDPTTLPPGSLTLLPPLSTLASWESVMDQLVEAGVTPISLGSAYGWPQAAWLQHLAGFLEGPQVATKLATGQSPLSDPVWSSERDLWNRWEAKGYLNADWKTLDWPQAVLSWAQGKAAFCLLTDSFLSTVPASQRNQIGRLSFPIGKTPWFIGSVWYLASARLSAQAEGGELLGRYLTSIGVTQRLSRSMNRTFYSENLGLTLVPSVTQATDSPFIKSLVGR